MKRTLTATALVAVALGTASPATAATAYLNGVLGVGPGFDTITAPDGARCTIGCERLHYDNLTDASAAAAIAAFVAEHGTSGNTIFAFSLGTNGVLRHLADNPDDRNTYVLLGSPSAPSSGNPAAVEIPDTAADVTFVTRTGDNVAQHAAPRATLSTHVSGYRYLDLRRDPVARESVSENVEHVVYDDTAKLSWRERVEQRRADRAERVAAYRQRVAERRAERQQRWESFWDRVRGDDVDTAEADETPSSDNAEVDTNASSDNASTGESGDDQ